jgi:hypothetical protein
MGAILIGVALVLAFFRPAGMAAGDGMRVLGVLMGLMVVFYANEVPKRLPQVTGCDPARQQSLRRFIGWTLVLGALGYAIAWIAAPIRIAPLLAILLLGAALTVVFGRITFVRSRS